MRKISFVLLLLQCLSAATAQQPYSKAVNDQIARVETYTGNELSKSLKNDFEYFRNAGFDHSVIKKASEILSL
jgi:hypothetical protein